ncbi:type III restriction-modification system endonuclease [Carnobacterium mobile]|uniref:type III restriction-modification system endonuclease n=1 Tax=Carnobacterium mobile TaxID=2750 RepID=UPI000558871B|nr:DEAD/DEAH box helicase family protein [Carnobacterium mobile]
MKIKFDELKYQEKAINSVINLFEGQGIKQSNFTVISNDLQGKLWNDHGIGNKIDLPNDELIKNLKKVQLENNIAPSEELENNEKQFNIEMETGTGKTYVYLKSILKLNKQYGFSKFVIVVPSLAIKEGVNKTLEMTKNHFKKKFNGIVYNSFTYNSKKLDQVRNFAVDSTIQVMVINIQAFIKDTKNKDQSNIIYRESDFLSGMRPIELIQETNPIVIIDEPQSVDNTAKSKEAIKSLNPSVIFRYSATHKSKYPLLYKLGPVEAYDEKLVKQIEVAGIKTENDGNDAYMRLVSVSNKSNQFSAKIEINYRNKNSIDKKIVTVRQGDDLYIKSNKLDAYDKGLIVSEIYTGEENEYIEFTSYDALLTKGKEIGGTNEDILKRQQIRKTIEEHLEKEMRLNVQGIKVLSLFFIDRVENYRQYDKDGYQINGKYADMFEEEYTKLINKPKFSTIRDKEIPVSEVHDGYFSVDNKGKVKDSSGKTAADDSTYNAIMKDKEELLTFYDAEKENNAANNKARKMRFIFSHSTLKEGWDNPNVFQICTLVDTKDTITKRQKIGRGLRLAVNQEGERQYGFDVNTLTVMANESYEEFAEGLQNEFEEESGIKFGVFEKDTFSNVMRITDEALGEKELLGNERAAELFEFFKFKNYIAKNGKATDALKLAIKEETLDIPGNLVGFETSIIHKTKSKIKTLEVKNHAARKQVAFKKEAFLNLDFKELWDSIKYKTTYSVEFDTETLITIAARDLREKVIVSEVKMNFIKAMIATKDAGYVTDKNVDTYLTNITHDYVAPDIITYLQNETELTRKTIVRILKESNTLKDFKKNPQMYMMNVAKIINACKRELIVDGIKYQKIGDNDYYSQELFDTEELSGYLERNMIQTTTERTIYDYVVYDSQVERKFATDCEQDPSVKFYIKLPNWFKIRTPLGNYNPDWAVLLEEDDERKLYFVAETKGSVLSEDLRPTERKKIECGIKHFEALNTKVELKPVESLEQLQDIARS